MSDNRWLYWVDKLGQVMFLAIITGGSFALVYCLLRWLVKTP